MVTRRRVDRDAVFEAERLVRSRFAAWNRADSNGLRAALHVPHVSMPGPRLSIRESELALLDSPDFRGLASVEGWQSSALDTFDIHQSSTDKVHCVVTFGRKAADGTRYANGQSIYVVTNRSGRWGIQLNSVTLRPIGGGADDGDAVVSAANVLRRWLEARDGDDAAAERRFVHLPFVELDGPRLLVNRSAVALRRRGARQAVTRGWKRSDVGHIRVRERSAHKVTLEADVARFAPGGARVGSDPVLVILTRVQGRWGLRVYSSFLTSPSANRRG